MKRTFSATVFAFLLTLLIPLQARADDLLIPVGQVVGLDLQNDTVTVAAFDDTLGKTAREAGLRIGDEILEIDHKPISCVEDVRSALHTCQGDVTITLRRGVKKQSLQMHPAITESGPKLGVYLRQGISGIGTITFYDPDSGIFGTLGHGVNDAGGTLLNMSDGNAYPAEILSIKKGLSGEPGQLHGAAETHKSLGSLYKNTPRGVFGISPHGWQGEAIPVADYDEIRTGPAVIRSTVTGNRVREYSVEILKIYPESRSDSRNLLLKVTDPQLLSTTGGIVQGMSGSPIIQDGKLIGAVTHVLVNDPTRGYGIFIENMLDAAA